MNKIVFDIETKNSFADVGGKNNMEKFDVSVVGIYSYNKDEYLCFDENEMDELGEILREANPLITYSGKDFDIPVLEKYFNYKLSAVPHYDIHGEIKKRLNRRISLDLLGEANLGMKKTESSGLKAIQMYNEGRMEDLKNYCLQDVRITKKIFDTIIEKGFLWVPQRNVPQMEKLEITFEPDDNPQDQLI